MFGDIANAVVGNSIIASNSVTETSHEAHKNAIALARDNLILEFSKRKPLINHYPSQLSNGGRLLAE